MNIPVGYFLSLQSGAPVMVVMAYEEDLSAGNPRHASVIKVKTGVNRDGTILAHHMEFVFDSGAYGSVKPAGYLRGPMGCAGPYRIANCQIEEKMVYTNKVPCGHIRAPGDPQGFFANESQMDIVARRLGMEIFAIAGDSLKVSPGELSLANEAVIHQRSKRRMSFAEVVRAKGSPIDVRGYYKQSEKTHHATIAAQIAEVEVDPETGQIKLRQFISAHTQMRWD